MKIQNIKAIKKNIYEVKVEKHDTFLLFDETILKYNILVGKDINEVLLKEIITYNKVMDSYLKILKKLKTKLRSKKEVTQLLKKEELAEDSINIILEKLEKINLVNDDKYIKAFISDRLNLSLDGPKKILNDLYNKGINKDKIALELDLTPKEVWQLRVDKIISKKIKSNHKYSSNELKNKLKVYLYNLGYENIFINLNIDDNEVLKKEYDKYLKKYQRKYYDEKVIKQKVFESLYKKGFKKDEIKNISK